MESGEVQMKFSSSNRVGNTKARKIRKARGRLVWISRNGIPVGQASGLKERGSLLRFQNEKNGTFARTTLAIAVQ